MFQDVDVISRYTRAQAIDDEVLVDVSKMAQEAGFKIPVAVTSTVSAKCHPPKSNKIESYDGRMWDVLNMARYYASLRANRNKQQVFFKVKIGRKNEIMKMIVGPGDDAEPVITIMMPDED